MINSIDRYRGSMLGLACGDALGTTLEFKFPGKFEIVTDMVGGGPFGLNPGEWTDDTSMALCLADSLITKKGFDPIDQLERYTKWYEDGYMSSNGSCFDIGSTVHSALSEFKRSRKPFCGSSDSKYIAGNGSLMRLAPVPLFYASKSSDAVHYSGESSRTTHQAVAAIDACRYMGSLIVGALGGKDKDTLLSGKYFESNYPNQPRLCSEIQLVADGSFKEKSPPEIKGTGYVVESLEAALWAFHNDGGSFENGCLAAVNLGNDADTTGAVYGQLAGAYYGFGAIPSKWISKIAHNNLIIEMADKLAYHSNMTP